MCNCCGLLESETADVAAVGSLENKAVISFASMELRRRKRNIRNIADHADVKRLRLSLGSNCVHQSVGVPQPVSEDPQQRVPLKKRDCVVCKKSTSNMCKICGVPLHYKASVGTNAANAPQLVGTQFLNASCDKIWHTSAVNSESV